MKLYKCLYRLFVLLAATVVITAANANDSEYQMSGNQLIPLQQSDISVRKEVLDIVEQNDGSFIVDVDYTFYNPNRTKTILMGFEAETYSPYISFPDGKVSKEHPYLYDFSVVLNGKKLPYKTAFIKKPLQIGEKIQGLSYQQASREYQQADEGSDLFHYAYYFKATFKHGENKLHHRYRFTYGNSVMSVNELGYLLTPANRWANKQIDDFTLNITPKFAKNFFVECSFFDDASHWQSTGQLTTGDCERDDSRYVLDEENKGMLHFRTDGNSTVTFKQKNFHPNGELNLRIPNSEWVNRAKVQEGYCFADFAEDFSTIFSTNEAYIEQLQYACKSANAFELKVLRNLPFAKRGYVFKDNNVQRYYEEHQPWYQADPNYRPAMNQLSDKEKAWVRYWKNPMRSPLSTD